METAGSWPSVICHQSGLSAPDGGFLQIYLRDLDTDGDGVLDEAGSTIPPSCPCRPAESRRTLTPAYHGSLPNGRYIVFPSGASNLHSTLLDTNKEVDVFVRDVQAVVVTTSPGTKPALSGDGRYLGFQSADALVPGDTNGVSDVFVRDLATGTVIRVSVSSSGVQANGGSSAAAVSRNGRFVVFESDASNLVAMTRMASATYFCGTATRTATASMTSQAACHRARQPQRGRRTRERAE